MVLADHNGQEPAGPMAITLGYQVNSVERHRFHMTVISVLRSCAVLASLKTRSLLRFNHHQESSFDQLEPPVRPVAHVDVFEVGRIALCIGIAAAYFRSCDEPGCPGWTCVLPSKPEGDTHHECSDGQDGIPPAPQYKDEHENREQDDVTERQPSLEHDL